MMQIDTINGLQYNTIIITDNKILKERPSTANEFANIYGLKNGIDMMRFKQFKMTGSF